ATTVPAEPKVGDFVEKKESAPPAEQKKEAPADEKKPRPSRRKKAAAESETTQKGVTDVVDENAQPAKAKPAEPIEFDTFSTTRPFLEFSSKWLVEPERTVDEAKAW